MNSLLDSVVSQVVGATTAKKAWDHLATCYASGSRTQVRQLKTQLHQLTRNNEDISVYMQRAKHISDQLATLQNPISEDDLVDAILNGLGTAYRPFVRSLEARLQSVSFTICLEYFSARRCKLKLKILQFRNPSLHY